MESTTMQPQYNPDLVPWEPVSPNNVAGKGRIERPGRVANLVWQTRAAEPTAYENQLGDSLEAAFLAGAQTPADIVAVLNERGPRLPSGQGWTEDAFLAEMRRLGA
ncbi:MULTISPECIES: recombinase-like helix-turn-helix domain-containing protein [Ralstonia]|uniref:recombinase-like helix-turn-helix domain-containing protein n=1 Tax=Ralstonia TaxID=48736 RepID=UPI0015E067D8|nr:MULTISPECIES: recombinase-like helix-turn-helix domain-containing protein [Ralstonia]